LLVRKYGLTTLKLASNEKNTNQYNTFDNKSIAILGKKNTLFSVKMTFFTTICNKVKQGV
jgi:hypothetical protein